MKSPRIEYMRQWRKNNFDKLKQYQKVDYAKKRNAGKCSDCGCSIKKGSKRCSPCFATHPELQSNYQNGVWSNNDRYEYQRIWRSRIENFKKLKKYAETARKRFLASGVLNKSDIQRIYEDNIKEFGTITYYLCLKPSVKILWNIKLP